MLVDGVKVACESCIKGHRSTTCTHKDRNLVEVKRKGRPPSQCPQCRTLRVLKGSHSKCNCRERSSSVRASEYSAADNASIKGESSDISLVTSTASTGGCTAEGLSDLCGCLTGRGPCTCGCGCSSDPVAIFKRLKPEQQWTALVSIGVRPSRIPSLPRAAKSTDKSKDVSASSNCCSSKQTAEQTLEPFPHENVWPDLSAMATLPSILPNAQSRSDRASAQWPNDFLPSALDTSFAGGASDMPFRWIFDPLASPQTEPAADAGREEALANPGCLGCGTDCQCGADCQCDHPVPGLHAAMSSLPQWHHLTPTMSMAQLSPLADWPPSAKSPSDSAQAQA
ncbi:uncharacterized protein L969DRAFT_70779 [Mixia osmundae IAM 14324]|uniref:Copper-fist domain-containing protein n=1 Tax=Mixia osmundae (strain CBS 9802 / IAM 14324 / JCM 22182 / KY 12970) TaxID=764103 RepID=G7DXV3_MIXOS|nr:uncharacterized protein L969DRAFT_70779 [Mixia osmundae IAM 14324]KEI41316.1 hypothetical protein L969DRAFT_70779 [Mixia osmundae IAM 14324]GAA95413.1 hypothetical protein E5Q_02067 [Mixia osmundae IAM 14324]